MARCSACNRPKSNSYSYSSKLLHIHLRTRLTATYELHSNTGDWYDPNTMNRRLYVARLKFQYLFDLRLKLMDCGLDCDPILPKETFLSLFGVRTRVKRRTFANRRPVHTHLRNLQIFTQNWDCIEFHARYIFSVSFLHCYAPSYGTTLACGKLSEILCVASKLWCLHLTMLQKRVAYPTRTFTRNWLTTLNTAYSIIYCWRPCQEKNLEIISYWSLILKKIFMVEEVLPFQVLFKLCSWILESCDIHVAHFALDQFLLHIWIRSCGDKRKFSIFSL